MSTNGGNGTPITLRSLMSTASWVIQATLVGLVTLGARWVQSQNEVNTQTAIMLTTMRTQLESRDRDYNALRIDVDKIRDKIEQLRVETAKTFKQ